MGIVVKYYRCLYVQFYGNYYGYLHVYIYSNEQLFMCIPVYLCNNFYNFDIYAIAMYFIVHFNA